MGIFDNLQSGTTDTGSDIPTWAGGQVEPYPQYSPSQAPEYDNDFWGKLSDFFGFSNNDADFQNEWNKWSLQEQERFAEYMSNTAVQRRMNDLRAAGINPVLAAAGQGASSATVGGAGGGHVNSARDNLMNYATRYFAGTIFPHISIGIGPFKASNDTWK